VSSKKTFSLIEILAVFALLAVMATLLTHSGMALIGNAKTSREVEKFQSFLSEVEALAYLYKVDLKVELVNAKKGLECKIFSDPNELVALKKIRPLKLKLLKHSKLEKCQLKFCPKKGWSEAGSFTLINTKNIEFSFEIESNGIKKRILKAA
jgi:hypothetical protein